MQLKAMQLKAMQKKVKSKLGKIREGSKKKTKADSNILALEEMFDKFMTAKKTEGLASRQLMSITIIMPI